MYITGLRVIGQRLSREAGSGAVAPVSIFGGATPFLPRLPFRARHFQARRLSAQSKERAEDNGHSRNAAPASAPSAARTEADVTERVRGLRFAKQAPATLVFTVSNRPGALKQALDALETEGVNILKIRSGLAPASSFSDNTHEITADVELAADHNSAPAAPPAAGLSGALRTVSNRLTQLGAQVTVLVSGSERRPRQRTRALGESNAAPAADAAAPVATPQAEHTAPWFPRRLSDLDQFASRCLQYGAELDANHPGFSDPEYRARRAQITRNAALHKHGMRLPTVDYTEQETATWRTAYTELAKLRKTHTSARYQHIFPLLEREVGFGPNRIPQLQEVSDFLRECTGWTLRPVMGLLSPRDFLNGLAFRVFHSTQYIRHHSRPLYTPEPDVCHELLGHAPMLCDESFADLSHVIGLASLGAGDEDIDRLAKCYWFSIEFGLCREPRTGEVRAYGAGLLSSYGELQHCLSDAPEKRTWDPFDAAKQAYPITEYQPLYYVADSLDSATEKLRIFSETLERPFSVHYNAYSQTVHVLDEAAKLAKLTGNMRTEINALSRALLRLEATREHAP